MRTFKEFAQSKQPKQLKIGAKDPVREAVANITPYWTTPGAAISAIAEILDQHGYTITDTISFNDNLPEFRTTYNLAQKTDKPFELGPEITNVLVFSWYKMDSGRYEITAYLS